MSPELKDWPGSLNKAISEAAGATPEKEENLRREYDKAYKKGDVDLVGSLAQQLSPITRLREDLTEVTEELANFIERNKLSNLNVPFPDLIPSLEVPKDEAYENETQREKKPEEISERRGSRKPEKYIKDAAAIAAKALLEKPQRKSRGKHNFKYQSLESIAKLILQKNQKRSKKAIDDAELYVYVVTKDLVSRIPVYATQIKTKSMADLTKKLLPHIKNSAWAEFYEIAGRDFANLSPQKFTDSVLLRLQKSQKTVEKLEKLREKKEKRLRISPSEITAADELILLNALSGRSTLDKLEGFLGSKVLFQVLETMNVQSIDSARNLFEENRSKMAAKRKNEPLTDDQRKESMIKIMKIMEQLIKDRRGWHKLSKEYSGFTFLYKVSGQLGADTSKVQKLTDILFSRREYQTNSETGFLLEIGKEQ